jgi:hypothetical protein
MLARYAKQPYQELRVGWPTLAGIWLSYVVLWFVLGLSLAFFVRGVMLIPLEQFPRLAGDRIRGLDFRKEGFIVLIFLFFVFNDLYKVFQSSKYMETYCNHFVFSSFIACQGTGRHLADRFIADRLFL